MGNSQSSVDVLLADDDEQIVAILQFMLERQGYSVVVARDGNQVRDYVSANFPPGLVMLDVMMPYVDGFELVDFIRQAEGWHDVPLVLLTGKNKEEDIVSALKKGVNDYINKPFQPAEVVARVAMLMKKHG